MHSSFLAASAALWLAVGSAAAQTVRGTLTDATTSSPVSAATISLLNAAGARVAMSRTDAAGRWSLQAPRADMDYRLRAERVGFARVETSLFRVAGEMVMNLQTRPEVVTLEGITQQALNREALMRRSETHRAVRTLLPDAVADRIRRRRPRSTGYLTMNLVAGLKVLAPHDWPTLPAARPRRGSCSAVVVVDGQPYFYGSPELVLDNIVPPAEIRAIEIFNDPSFIPRELDLEAKRNPLDPPIHCGAIAIWTKDGIGVP